MQRKGWGAVLVATVLVGTPAVAQGATQTVFMGTPPSAQKSFEKSGLDANQFFPSSVTIRVGDKVKFAPVGFHNLDVLPLGGKPVPLIVPNGTKVAGAADAAGTAFWFNGLDNVGFNPSLLKSGFGKSFTASKARRIQSGLPLGPNLKPVTVTFKKAGTYRYVCDIHPGMSGSVKVSKTRKGVQNAKAVATAVAAQLATDRRLGAALAKTTVPKDSVVLGPEKSGVWKGVMAPAKLTVTRGTVVSFLMPAGSREVHTATFGPGDPRNSKAKSYLGDLAASFEAPVIDPIAVYPSEAPPAVPALSPTAHGNGFANTGILDGAAASPLPPAGKIRFDAAGTYDYYCLIHPFMKGEITVK